MCHLSITRTRRLLKKSTADHRDYNRPGLTARPVFNLVGSTPVKIAAIAQNGFVAENDDRDGGSSLTDHLEQKSSVVSQLIGSRVGINAHDDCGLTALAHEQCEITTNVIRIPKRADPRKAGSLNLNCPGCLARCALSDILALPKGNGQFA